jgi:hypothetical protein
MIEIGGDSVLAFPRVEGRGTKGITKRSTDIIDVPLLEEATSRRTKLLAKSISESLGMSIKKLSS